MNYADKTIVAIDSQKLSTFSSCNYKYDLTFNRDLVPVETQDYFERGDLIHKMLQAYYSMHKFIDRWPSDFDKAKVLKVCERVGEHHAIKMDLQIEEVDTVMRTFREYLDYYWGEQITTLFVERVGAKVLHEDDELVIIYETKIDWAVRLKNVNRMPVDHKSSYRRGPTFATSNQFVGYCWMLNVCNLMVNKVGFQKTVKAHEKFTRPILSYPPAVIEHWRQNTIWWVRQMLIAQQTGFYAQNFTSCDKFSSLSNEGCIFRRVCEGPPESADHTMAQLFDISEEKWDPGKRGL